MFGIGKSSGKTIMILDVGSASAAASIMVVHGDSPSIIVSSHRSNIPNEKRAPDQAASGVALALGEAIDQCNARYAEHGQKSHGAPKELYIFVRAPWAHSRSFAVTERYETEEKLTDAHIDALAKKAISENKADTQNPLEAIILRTEINGYATSIPVGKRAHVVRLSMLVSTAEPALVSAIASTLEKKIPALRPVWRTHTRALLSVMRDSRRAKSCMAIDMANEGTNAVIIRDGIMDEELQIAEGASSILEKLAPNALAEETMSLVRMLEREQCSVEACDALKENMAKAEQELVRSFGEQFAAYTQKKRLPNDVLLIVHADLSPWLERFFSRIDFSQFTLTSQPFSVLPLTSKDLETWVSTEPGVVPDVSIMLAAALVHIDANTVS